MKEHPTLSRLLFIDHIFWTFASHAFTFLLVKSPRENSKETSNNYTPRLDFLLHMWAGGLYCSVLERLSKWSKLTREGRGLVGRWVKEHYVCYTKLFQCPFLWWLITGDWPPVRAHLCSLSPSLFYCSEWEVARWNGLISRLYSTHSQCPLHTPPTAVAIVIVFYDRIYDYSILSVVLWESLTIFFW